MTEKMLDTLVNALSQPTLVDILLLIVTTAYFVATVFVYRANKKMAEAAENQIKAAMKMAELSRNVELYDRRMELIEYVNSSHFGSIYGSNDFQIKLAVLFPNDEIMRELNKLNEFNKLWQTCNSEIGTYSRNTKDLSVKYLSLSGQIAKALANPEDQEEIRRVKELADQNIVSIKVDESLEKQLNLFELVERQNSFKEQCEHSKRELIEEMIAFLEETILIRSQINPEIKVSRIEG